jgi:hypothetical protein
VTDDQPAEDGDDDKVVIRVPYTALSRQLMTPEFVLSAQRVLARAAIHGPTIDLTRRLLAGLPTRLELPAFAATAASVRLFTGSSAFAAAVEAQEARARIFAMLGDTRLKTQLALLDGAAFGVIQQQFRGLSNIARLIEMMPPLYKGLSTPLLVERSVGIGVRGWDEATRAIGTTMIERRAEPLRAFGRGTLGIAAAGIALSAGSDETDTTEAEELLGPRWVAAQLRERLAQLDPSLPDRLDGAWERVSRAGPDAASQAAHSIMETLDGALRNAAPDAEVIPWCHEAGHLAELHEGRPTRALRVKYLLRGRPGETKAARMHLRALSDLVQVIQDLKHSSSDKDLLAVARLIPTVEGLLIFVLL